MGTWVARNIGLTSQGTLIVHYIIQNPATRHLPSTSHDLWIATDGGIYRSLNGGRQWDEISLPSPSNVEFMRSRANSVAEIDFHWIDYDPTDELTLYALAADQTNELLWIYKTTDLGVNWISRGLIVQFQF